MIFGFDSDDAAAATGALLVYAIWRSRDRTRFKVTPDVWGRVERFTKAAAKRAETLPAFIEALKPRLQCATIHPRAMAVGISGVIPLVANDRGELLAVGDPGDQREFLTGILGAADEGRVLDTLSRETAWVVLLVRDRLERERPVAARFETVLDEIGAGDA